MKLQKKSGFTLVEIMIVVAIIGLLAAIAIPSFLNARKRSMTASCKNSLRQIAGGIDQYTIDRKGVAPTAISDLVGTDNYIKKTPSCPVGNTTYAFPTSGDPVCPNVGTYPEHVLEQ